MNFKILNKYDKEKVKGYIDKLPEDKIYEIEISLKRKKRSIPQNRLYWLWITCISHETGNDKDFLHEYFSEKYLPKKSEIIFNHEIIKPVSTTSLDAKQFTDYLDKIQIFASSEQGIILPNPGDIYWKEFYEYYKDRI
jgi:hypothetical protein